MRAHIQLLSELVRLLDIDNKELRHLCARWTDNVPRILKLVFEKESQYANMMRATYMNMKKTGELPYVTKGTFEFSIFVFFLYIKNQLLFLLAVAYFLIQLINNYQPTNKFISTSPHQFTLSLFHSSYRFLEQGRGGGVRLAFRSQVSPCSAAWQQACRSGEDARQSLPGGAGMMNTCSCSVSSLSVFPLLNRVAYIYSCNVIRTS